VPQPPLGARQRINKNCGGGIRTLVACARAYETRHFGLSCTPRKSCRFLGTYTPPHDRAALPETALGFPSLWCFLFQTSLRPNRTAQPLDPKKWQVRPGSNRRHSVLYEDGKLPDCYTPVNFYASSARPRPTQRRISAAQQGQPPEATRLTLMRLG
jgi:hypothetical protein